MDVIASRSVTTPSAATVLPVPVTVIVAPKTPAARLKSGIASAALRA